jgi:hypothetical protein
MYSVPLVVGAFQLSEIFHRFEMDEIFIAEGLARFNWEKS